MVWDVITNLLRDDAEGKTFKVPEGAPGLRGKGFATDCCQENLKFLQLNSISNPFLPIYSTYCCCRFSKPKADLGACQVIRYTNFSYSYSYLVGSLYCVVCQVFVVLFRLTSKSLVPLQLGKVANRQRDDSSLQLTYGSIGYIKLFKLQSHFPSPFWSPTLGLLVCRSDCSFMQFPFNGGDVFYRCLGELRMGRQRIFR